MDTNTLTILLAVLGSSVITAVITALGKRKTDQALINSTLLDNARKDILQIRAENSEMRTRISELEKKITSLQKGIEDYETLLRIAEKENLELKAKNDCLEKELSKIKEEIVAQARKDKKEG